MISVIIPLYNKEAIIERTLRSVLLQDYDDYEVIIVDDGSTDRSADIVKQFISELPPFKGGTGWVFISQQNGGPSKARNTGIKNAKGEWLYFIDADDEMMPGALLHLSKMVEQYPNANLIFGEHCIYNGVTTHLRLQYKDEYIKNPYKEHALGRLIPCSGTVLYHRTVCAQNLYNEDIRRYEDLECMLRKFKSSRLYTTHFCLAKINVQYAAASRGRNNIKEDFMGHLSFKGKSFWERINIYHFFLSERPYYWQEAKNLYPSWFYRYDLLLLSKLINLFSPIL